MNETAEKMHDGIMKEYHRRFKVYGGRWHMQAFTNMMLYQSFVNFLNHKREGMTRTRFMAMRKLFFWMGLFSFLDVLPVMLFAIGLQHAVNAFVEIGIFGSIWALSVYLGYSVWFLNYGKRLAKEEYNELMKQAKVPKNKWGR